MPPADAPLGGGRFMDPSLASPVNEELFNALLEADLVRAVELMSAGADLNAPDRHGETILSKIIPCIDDIARRRSVVRFMLDHGANPRLLTDDGGGPLLAAVIARDTEVLRMLLDHGADPNREHDGIEPLYDYAEFDYRYEIYDMKLPEEPTEADRVSADAWVQFLDRLAIRYGKRRPDYLILLRQRGAISAHDRQRPTAGGD